MASSSTGLPAVQPAGIHIIVPEEESEDTICMRVLLKKVTTEDFVADKPEWSRGENGRRHALKCVNVARKLVFDCNAPPKMRVARTALCVAAGYKYIHLKQKQIEFSDLSEYSEVLAGVYGPEIKAVITAAIKEPALTRYEITETQLNTLLVKCTFDYV